MTPHRSTSGPRKSRRPTTGQHTFVRAFLPHWDRVRWPEITLGLAVIGAPLALGSVHVEAQLILAGLALMAFGGAAWKLGREGRKVRVGLIGVALLLASLWTFLQWLPLPVGLVELVMPASVATRRVAAELAGLPMPEWVPLTLDQGRTAAAFASLIGLTFTYLAATSLRGDSNARARMTIYVEVAALGVLVAGLVHEALGLTAIWGIYDPVMTTLGESPFVSTFVNPNHSAALMMVGALVACGASLSPERSQRWHLGVGLALAAGVLLSMSRANAALLIAGILVLTIPPLFVRAHRESRARLVRLAIGALCCLFVALIFIGPERWASEFATLDRQDFGTAGLFQHCWVVGREVVSLAPWTGVGNGAFALAANGLIDNWSYGQLSYAHHGVYQVLSDLGVIVGGMALLLAGIGFARVAWRSLRLLPELSNWGVCVAIGAVAAQNMVDFSLWIQGVAVPVALLLGVAVGGAWPPVTERAPRAWWSLAWSWPLALTAVALGMAIVTGVPAYRERADGWRAAVRDAIAAGEPDRVDRGALAMDHPHDYFAFDLLAALAKKAGRTPEAERWVGRALELAPSEPETVEAAVRVALARRDEARAIALVERLARQPRSSAKALELVLGAPWAKELSARFFEKDPQRAIDASVMLAARGDGAAADKLLVWALERFPDAPELYERLGHRRWGDRAFIGRLATDCLAKAGAIATLQNATAAEAVTPASTERRAAWERLGYLFQGHAEAMDSRDLTAWNLFLAAADAVPGKAGEPLVEAGKAADRMGRFDLLEEVVKRLADTAVEGAWPRGEMYLLRSRLAEVQGDVPQAIREMHEALRHLGHVAGLHARLAGLYERVYDSEAADRARARARAIESGHAEKATP